MKGVGLSHSFSPAGLLCLKSSRSKYSASIINHVLVVVVLVVFFLHFDLKKI